MFKAISKVMCISFALLTLSACEDQLIQGGNAPIGGKTIGDGGNHPDDFKNNNGESYPLPEVTFHEYIPAYDLFSDLKCKTWRIEWPWYDDDFDFNLIPTMLSVNSGELNSFNYLNSTEPENTFNSTLSLYYGDRVEETGGMWYELEYTFDTPGDGAIESVEFIKGNLSTKSLKYMVEERPGLFTNYWPGGATTSKIDYQEGDFIHFWIADRNLYGGIRIVSMTPRIIEVYLAVPND